MVTGFALFFLASVHLYQMLMHPGLHRPVRVGRPRLERPLVAAVPGAAVRGRAARRHRPVPAGASSGAGSQAPTPTPRASNLKKLKWALSVFFLVLGLATLAAYMKIGYRAPLHAGRATCRPGCRPAAGRAAAGGRRG
ncbi:MAG: hypothetical protein MZV64_44765 [Ignavibacteriales bacterium]|nr:hypothetical protein [Ignavibacteriales bacterium]